MPVRIVKVELRGWIAEFRVEGEIDFSSMADTLMKVHEVCHAEHSRGALVDITHTTGDLDGLERFRLAASLAPEWDRRIILSVLIPKALFSAGHIAQLAAQNRSVRVRTFTERNAAVAWLERAVGDLV